MSNVYKRNREDTELQFMVTALDLQVEVTKFVVNEKYVPKKWRLLIAKGLIDKVDELVDNVTAANTIYAKTEDEFKKRQELQTAAIANCIQIHHKIVRMEKCIQTVKIDKLSTIIDLLGREIMLLKRWKKTDKIKN